MTWLLELLHATPLAATPHFRLIEQAVALTPWWYPLIYLAAFAMFFTVRGARRARLRRDTRMAMRRVRARTGRIQDPRPSQLAPR